MNDDGACGASEVATLGPPCLEGGSAAWLSTPTRGPLSPLPPCALLLVARNKVKNQPYSPCGGGLSYRVRPHVVFPPMGSTQKPGSVTVRLFYQPALAHMTGARGWPRPKPMGRPRLCLSGCVQGPPPWRRVTMGPKGGCTPEVVVHSHGSSWTADNTRHSRQARGQQQPRHWPCLVLLLLFSLGFSNLPSHTLPCFVQQPGPITATRGGTRCHGCSLSPLIQQAEPA